VNIFAALDAEQRGVKPLDSDKRLKLAQHEGLVYVQYRLTPLSSEQLTWQWSSMESKSFFYYCFCIVLLDVLGRVVRTLCTLRDSVVHVCSCVPCVGACWCVLYGVKLP